MAILSGYYDSINGDRKYNASTMSQYFSGLFTRGVLQNYKGKFVVKATEGMSVKIPTGKAFFSDGKWIENTADITLTLDASDVVLNRIDSIVLRNDKNEAKRKAEIVLKKGTPAANPVPPGVEETSSYVEELLICNIRVDKLTENITQSNITNTIPDTDVCGYVTGLIEEVDTSDLYIQYEAAYKEFQAQSKKEFDDWFADVKETLSTSTLIREYKSTYITKVQDEQNIDIAIPQYNSVLDILQVLVNGLRLNGQEYTVSGKTVTLKRPVDVGTPIEFVIYKSVDGSNAETIIEQVEHLQQIMNTIEKGIYVATGENDNIKLSEIVQEFLKGGNDYKQLEIDVYGALQCTSTYSGNGTESDPYVWFMLGQKASTSRRVRINFAHCDRISIDNQSRANSVLFGGNDIFIKNCQAAIYNASSTSVFNGERIDAEGCELWINAAPGSNTTIIGGECCGTFTRCRVLTVGGNGNAYGFRANGGILKLRACEIIAYNEKTTENKAVAVEVEANKTENVLIMHDCNLPIRTRDGYKQSETIEVNGGHCSLVSNIVGKAPKLYSDDQSKCANVGTLVVSK